jgi:signal transduction histidine kinase
MSASGTRYGQSARVLLLALAGLLALGVAGSLMMSVRARNDAQKQIVEQAETIVQRSLTLAFQPDDLEGPVDAERATQLSQQLTSVVFDPSDFAKVTLYSADGTILYTTELSRIGTQLVGEQGRIQEALKGIIQNRTDDGSFSTLMSFRFPSGVGRPSAVELVRDDGPLTSAVAPWRTTALFLFVVLVLIGLVAWGVNRIAAAASMAAATAAAAQPRPQMPPAAQSVPAVSAPQQGLREEGEARRRAEERARAAEDRVGLLQEQYRKALEELQQFQMLAREPHSGDPVLEERALRAEGQVATLEQQIGRLRTEREQLAQALHEAGHDPVADPAEIAAQHAALREAHQETMGLRAELEGANAQLEMLRRELTAAKASGGTPSGDLSGTHAELARTKDELSTASAQLRSAQRELEDARTELRALRTEEQRAAMLDDELRTAKTAADSLEASHRAELVEREAELEEKVRVTREEFQRQLEEIETSYKGQLGKREAALAGRITEAEAQSRDAARELETVRRELEAARAEAASRDQRLLEASDEIRVRRSELATLQAELDDRRRAADMAAGLAEQAGATAEELQGEIHRAHEAVAQLREELAAERTVASEAAERAERAERERTTLATQTAQIGQQLDAAAAENAELNRRLQEIEARRQLELADDQGRAEIDDLLRVTQERLAGQTDKLMATEDRVRELETELTSAKETIEVTETELRTHRMSEALKEMREGEHGEAPAEVVPAPAAIEDRRASSPFTKELSLDAKKNLARIMGITQILKHKRDAKEQAQLIKQLTTYARRLDHTVADLAEADRLAHGEIELQIKRADLEALVHRVVEETGADGEHDIRVVAESVAVGVDAQRVEQIVAGLLRNSIDRTTGGKEIVVRLAPSEGGALVSVEDGEASSDASLSPVVKRFAEAHGGWAKVESRPDGGSAFRVFLPDGAPVSDEVKVLVDAPAADVWDDSAGEILVQELHRLAEAEGSEGKVKTTGRSRRASRKG